LQKPKPEFVFLIDAGLCGDGEMFVSSFADLFDSLPHRRIPTYVPRGRKAEDGRIDERYNLVELSTSSYPVGTRRTSKKATAP